jgi:hypothetical protein
LPWLTLADFEKLAAMKNSRSSTKRVVAQVIGVVSVVALFAAGIAYACGYFDPDPRLDEVHALQAKLMAGGLKPEKLLDKKNWDLIGEIQKKVQLLPPDLKKQVETEGRSKFETMIDDHIKQALAMSPADRQAQLDKDLALMQMMALFRPQASANSAASSRTQNQISDSDRTKLRKRYLSSVPAATRAARTTYFQLLQARANSRGIVMPMTGR